MTVDVRSSEKDATVVCTILDIVSLTAVDIDVQLSLTAGVDRIDLIELTRSTTNVRLWRDHTFIGYSVVDSRVRVTDITRGPAVEAVATRSHLELGRMSRLDATLVDSRLDDAFVEEEANLDLSASIVEDLCAPGELVIRAAQGSSVTYDCDPDVLDIDADETSDVQPVP
jgi:hypothetical protein